jgi:exodeoxyribonuclease-3
MVVVGYGASELEDLLEAELGKNGRYVNPDPNPEKGYFYRSDHISLAKRGVPMLYADGGFDFVNGGREAGFEFEESGVFDNVTVTATKTGAQEQFKIDSWFAGDNSQEARALRDFLRKNQDASVVSNLQANYDASKKKLQADFDKISVASISVPSGLGDDDKLDAKNEFMDQFSNHLRKTLRKRRDFIFCGTINTAHKPEDLSGWYVNQKNSGFLPEERDVLDEVFFQMEFCDAFRQVNQNERQFTWWPDYNRAFKLNEGARLDYQITTPNLRRNVRNAGIYREQRFSNHAPLIIDYNCDL